jgi:hypothetical protein
MKKYKLIKQYPGSVELGTIVEKCSFTGSGVIGNNKLYTNKKGFGVESPENYPEFWEEVVEKDYEILISRVVTKEILSVKRLSDGEVFTIGDRAKTITSKGKHTVTQLGIRQKCTGRDGKGGWNYDGIDRIWIDWEDNCGGNWLESTEKVIEKDYEILSQVTKYNPLDDYKASGTKIHSVKRLSDGKVFSIGDALSNICGSKQLIKEFYLNKEGIMCVYTDRTCRFSLDYIEVKNPIFLTHDGKDIFEGDKVWWVRKDSTYYDSLISVPWMQFYSNLNAYFLTEEAALNYINKNKVLFTTEDGVDIKHGDTYYFVDTDFNINTSKANFQAVAMSDKRKYFSTVEEAHEYVMQNVKALSIKDFWEITCMSTSNFNKSTYMRDLVKKALGIK